MAAWKDVLGAGERRLAGLREAQAGLREQLTALQAELRRVEVQREPGEAQPAGWSRVAWGDPVVNLPLSDDWGADCGRGLDRYYIEQFIETHAADIRGRVLEVHDADYTSRFGGGRVEASDVVDIKPWNPRATIVADSAARGRRARRARRLHHPDADAAGRDQSARRRAGVRPDAGASKAHCWQRSLA